MSGYRSIGPRTNPGSKVVTPALGGTADRQSNNQPMTQQ